MFHLYKGVRAGGGIGDEIEPPDGDANEVRTLLSVLYCYLREIANMQG